VGSKAGPAPRVELTRRMRRMLIALAAMTSFILIRSIYRTVELADGFSGIVIKTQWLFVVFDALMIVFAMYTLNVYHPGILLLPEEAQASSGQTSEVNLVHIIRST